MAKIALLIGISEYQPGFDPLPGTQTDIREMQRVLEHPQMGGFDQVAVLPNPDTGGMQLAIEKLLADRQRDDLVLLYFSGHGFKDEDGSLYFVTRTTEQRSPHQIYQSTAVPARVVQDWMSRSRCKRLVLVLDCCFSGAFAEGMKAKAVNETVDINAQFGGEGRAVLTSSTALQYSFEQQEASIYTRYLVEGIESGAADTDSNGMITIDELHDYARRKVQEAAPAMKPEIFAVKEGYTIVLAKAPLGDPKLEYRKEVERLAQQRSGQLSRIVLRGLDVTRKRFNLSLEEAETIQLDVLQPFRDFEDKQQQYEQEWRDAIQEEFPLSEATRADLQYFQQVLGLRDEDIAEIEARVSPAKDFYERGLAKYNAGDFQGAIADYSRTITLQPDYVIAYKDRGNAHLDLGDKQAAIEDYTQAIKLKPDYADAYNNRGNAHADLGDQQAAIEDYTQAIKLKPDNALAYNNRGNARAALGDQQAAIADYNQAVQINQNWGDIGLWVAYNNRGTARADLGDQQAAIEDYNLAIKLKPNYAAAYNNRGNARKALGEQQAAIKDYGESIRLNNPELWAAYNNRGNARATLGDQQGAIQDYDQAIKLQPNYANAYYSRGLARATLGDQQAAIQDYQKAADLYQQQRNTEWYQKALDRIKEFQK